MNPTSTRAQERPVLAFRGWRGVFFEPHPSSVTNVTTMNIWHLFAQLCRQGLFCFREYVAQSPSRRM